MTTKNKAAKPAYDPARDVASRTAKANTESLALLERIGETLPDCGIGIATASDAERAESIRAGLKFLARSLGLAA